MAKTSVYLLLLSTACFMWSTSAVSVGFEMTDRQVLENQGPCDVILSKTGKLEEDIVLRVRALTIRRYENITGRTFTENVPHAEETDFDSSYEEMITFEASGDYRQRKLVAVSVVNDDVHEVNEEFLLYFDVIRRGNLDIITTKSGRNPVRCRIANDDDVKIGLESREYTVGEGSNLVSQVFITKLDGTSTEVDIDLTLSTTGLTATQGIDYVTPSADRFFDLTFPSTQKELGIPITIPSNDDLDEENRKFVLQFSNNGVDRLITGNTFAQIIIEDTTLPSPSPSSSSSPAPSSTVSSSTSSPSLPEPELTVINPAVTSALLTNLPQETGGAVLSTTAVPPQVTKVPIDESECDDEKEEDLGLAIGLTFLLTFLLTALCAAIIIVFVVIADRRRRDERNMRQQQQLS